MDKIIPQDAFEAVVSAINRHFAANHPATIEEIAQAAEVESWIVREMIEALVMWDRAKVVGQDTHLRLRYFIPSKMLIASNPRLCKS